MIDDTYAVELNQYLASEGKLKGQIPYVCQLPCVCKCALNI